jgi:hypothetical protein
MTDLLQLRRKPLHCCVVSFGGCSFTCDTFDVHLNAR